MADTEISNNFQANFEETAEKVSNAEGEENHVINNNLRDLPKCPVCLEEIRIIPIFECTNGHVICSDCIPKLENEVWRFYVQNIGRTQIFSFTAGGKFTRKVVFLYNSKFLKRKKGDELFAL